MRLVNMMMMMKVLKWLQVDDDEVVEYDGDAEEGLEVATGDDDGEGHQHQCHH